ncbi:hypothetical protein HZR84_02320 [Hyphobacterium sp. CCMP332]|nr:hypothetical protein HZR84_02320 [Hyphobacterium sp. CCMP332]
MKKLLLVLVSVVFLSEMTFAQLSQRQSNPSNYSTGTRPLAGDMGIFLAVDVFDAQSILDDIAGDENPSDELEVPNFSLVNFKYYNSNDVVYRIGLVAAKDKSVEKGDLFFATGTAPQPTDIVRIESKNSERDYAIKPGVEKHFNPTNLIDIYVGVEALLGTHIQRSINSQERNDGNTILNDVKGTSLLYGAGGFVGMQFFIADLPLALGLEYGIIGKGYAFKRYKVVQEQDDGTGTFVSNEFFVRPGDITAFNGGATVPLFESLSSRTYNLDNQVRVTLSYFFSN